MNEGLIYQATITALANELEKLKEQNKKLKEENKKLKKEKNAIRKIKKNKGSNRGIS